MVVTGYFLDQDWNYCEVLLGFEPLDGSHSGAHLSETVIKILQQHNIMKRVLSVTTDNASNNNTMVAGIQEVGQLLGLSEDQLFRIPCIIHVIQLSLRELLGEMKANPVNDEIESTWVDTPEQSQQSKNQQYQSIFKTLKKVSSTGYLPFFLAQKLLYLPYSKLSYRVGRNLIPPPTRQAYLQTLMPRRQPTRESLHG